MGMAMSCWGGEHVMEMRIMFKVDDDLVSLRRPLARDRGASQRHIDEDDQGIESAKARALR